MNRCIWNGALSRLPGREAALALALWAGAAATAQPWVQAETALDHMRSQEFPEAAAAYGEMVAANPYDGFAWSQWGYCLHGSKQYEEALTAFARAVELGFGRPNNLYNSACALALLGRKDEAIARLEEALAARFADQEVLENDSDMDSLRSDGRFAALTGLTGGLSEPPTSTREAGWRWDLDFFVRRMEQMHWDLYANVPQATFAAEVDRLKRDVAGLSDSQIRARLRRLTAMVGDGHTASRLFAEGESRRTLPLHLFAFKDGVHVIGAAPGHEDLVGARVLAVGSLDVDAAMAAVRPYISVDNEMGYLAGGPAMLTSPPILHAIGAAPDESGVDVRVRTLEGTEKSVRIEPVEIPGGGHGGFLMSGYRYVHDGASGEPPLFLRRPNEPNWMEYLPEHKTVYVSFRAVADPQGSTLEAFARELFALIEEKGAESLIIDMRFNGGGNTGLVRPLVHGLIGCEAVNRRGHLWVIIGRNTFSAAQNTVNLIEHHTAATFVGEPTGSRPAFVGESTSFILPHSRTRVFCSSRYWQHMDSTDERTWVQPQVAADMTFAAYAAGRDPALEAITPWLP